MVARKKATDEPEKRADLPHFESFNSQAGQYAKNGFAEKQSDNPANANAYKRVQHCTDKQGSTPQKQRFHINIVF